MSFLRRLTSSFGSTAIIILLATLVAFALFVYPSPQGSVFTMLRVLAILLLGYLFFQFRSVMVAKSKSFPEKKLVVREEGEVAERPDLSRLGDEEQANLEQSIREVLEVFSSVYPSFMASVFLKNLSRNELVQRGYVGQEYPLRTVLSLEDANVLRLLKIAELQVITLSSDEGIYSTLFEDTGSIPDSAAALVSPIAIGNSWEGFLLVQAEKFSDFEEHDRHVVASYSNLLGTMLGVFESLSALRSDNVFYSHLNAFHGQLDIMRSQDDMLSALVSFCEFHFSFDKLTISLIDEAHPEEAVIRCVSGFSMDCGVGYRFSIAESLHGSVIAGKKPVMIDNLISAESIEGRFVKGDIEEFQFLSFLGVPIRNSNGIQGAIALESFASRKYSDPDLRMLEVLSSSVGILLEWWQKYDRIRETATKDGLTGLLNRRSFLERFEDEIGRATRFQENLVLLILDLDKFKRINDSYGHLYGDFVLAEVASTLRESVRNIDVVARYGGEEFAIILINTTKVDTLQTMKRIVANIAERDYNKDGTSVRMTISAGAAEFPLDGSTIVELIGKADEAMYVVKRKGGNDVELAPSPVS